MCAFPNYNSDLHNDSILTDNTLINMALIDSINTCDKKLCDCVNTCIKLSKDPAELASTSRISSTMHVDSHNLLDRYKNINDKKSLYVSKACKYSFIASDYTSPEGLKFLSIKVYQKPTETDLNSMKGKCFLSKRSISEYFLSKSGLDKYAQSEKEKINHLNPCQATVFKAQVLVPHVAENSWCDMQNTTLYDSNEDPLLFASIKSTDITLPFDENNFPVQMKQAIKSLNAEPCTSENIEILIQTGVPDNLYLSTNPSVNCKVFDIESLSGVGEACNNEFHENIPFGLDDAWFIENTRNDFNNIDVSGSASVTQLSMASSYGDSGLPTCKICHITSKPEDPLISPCRCTGTLRYIHCGCLMKWLEICNKRSRKPPTCELCKYQFHWHKKFKIGQWQFPHCSWQDKILHTVFFISVLIMIGCAIVTVICFRQHQGVKAEIAHLELTQSEIITLICGALFFLAFFLAMYVEIKARNTIYKLLLKFLYLNQQWYIDEYDKRKEATSIDV